MKRIKLLAFTLGCFLQLFSQTNYYVATTGHDTNNNGLALGTPFLTIAKAISTAASGDIINIAAGTYTEYYLLNGVDKSLTFNGAGAGLTIVQAHASPFQTLTNNKMVFNPEAIYTANRTITIQNMTIQNGYNNGSGGGVRAYNKATGNFTLTLNLTNINFYKNSGTNGGAIVLQGTAATGIVSANMTGCSMTENTSTTNGGAIYVNTGSVSVTIDRCNISTNTAPTGGAIAFASNTIYPINATIKNCTLSGNKSTTGNGGAINALCGNNASTSVDHKLWLENTTIYGNQAQTSTKVGGGIYFKTCTSGQASTPTQTLTLNHCTIAYNTTNAGTGGDGVCIENSGGYATTLAINNSIIMGNSGSTSNASQVGVNNSSVSGNSKIAGNTVVTNSILGIISGGTWVSASTTNNILTAAVGDLAFAGSLSSDFTPVLAIGFGSYAKNFVGTNYITPLTSDQLGNTRSGSADAGAYEYNTNIAISATGTGGSITGTGTKTTGDAVTLVATPSGSNVFTNWTENGFVVSTNASYSFTAAGTRTLVANFGIQNNVQTANDGNGSVTGAATVVSGNSVTLTATPNAGYAFSAFTVTSGTASFTSANPLTFTPTADCTITASFTSITALTPTVSYARTASTIDVVVTNPVGYIGTLTYNVLDGNDNVLASAVASTSSPQTVTLVYSASGLTANTTYTYKVIAVINGLINSATATLSAITRKFAPVGGIQVIDNFVDNSMVWSGQNSPTFTIPFTNTITDGINPSANCAKVSIAANKANYTGLQNSYEKIQIGPNAPYRYLHIKMYRDADDGTIGLTFLARKDITLAQLGSADNLTVSNVSASGPWVDYVFDLKHATYSSDNTYFGFYIKPNRTSANTNVASNSYIDDVYLSNDGTASTGNVTFTVATSAGTGGSVSSGATYVTGSNVSFTATPSSGYHFVNWTESGSLVSTDATYAFSVSANRTLVANFEPNTVPVSSGTTNAADITCTTCDVTVAAGAELTVGATQTLKSVTVAAGGKLTLSAGTLTATNGITLESDANGTATMLQSGTLTGTVIAKQYLGSARNWYVSSPIANAASPSNNMDYYYEYVEAGDNNPAGQPGSSTVYWKGLANGTTMEIGKGYIAKTNAGATVQFSGTPNNGNITTAFNLTRNDAKGKGFNLVGNPYPSYIDWTAVAAANPSLDNTYYYRTKNSSDAYTFVTWNGAGSNYVVSNGSLAVNTTVTRYIPPTQAFWVRVKTGTSTTQMNFTNAMREHRDDNGNLMKARKQDNRTSIRLQLQNGINTDELLIYQDLAASNGYDAYDSPKMMNNSATVPDLYSKVNDERLVINGLNTIIDKTELPLGFSLNAAATLKFKVSELNNLPEGTQLYLRDKQENTETELTPATEYSFNTATATSNNESRFSLLFKAPSTATGVGNPEREQISVFVNIQNQITIVAKPNSKYCIYNAMGQLMENGVLKKERETRNTKLAAGIYVVKVGNTNSTRVIIK